MVPLKAIIVGGRWEVCRSKARESTVRVGLCYSPRRRAVGQLAIDLCVVLVLLVLMYKYLHAFKISTAWYAILAYAIAIATIAELTHFFRCTSTRGSNPRSSRAERVVRPARPPLSPWSGQLVGQRRHGGRGRDGALGSFASGLHGWLRRRPHPQPTQAQWWPQAAVHTDEAEAYQ